MMSVTQRIRTVSQPRNGYLKIEQFKVEKYFDDIELDEIPTNYKSSQGLVVDYMVRYLSGFPKSEAFKISLLGAQNVSESERAEELLKNINGLNEESIYFAYQVVEFDVAYRRGPSYYVHNRTTTPNQEVIRNTIQLIKRTLAVFNSYGPITKTGFTFAGGYNEIISSGDGDYLTRDTLWDLKVSPNEPKKEDTLQLLVYYILGHYSIHEEFENIQKLAIYNPILNKAYLIELSDIPIKLFSQVTHQVVGYKIPANRKLWDQATTTDLFIYREARKTFTPFSLTDFDPSEFKEGIHDISVDDYWTYYGTLFNKIQKPKFNRTKQMKFLKRGRYYMFISINHKGKKFVLNGGSIRTLDHEIDYYYSNLTAYGDAVIATFSEYWKSLKEVSSSLKKNIPEKNENLGKIHGSIVDIDYFNHVYLNPFDRTLTPYFATSTTEKIVYRNVISLLAARKPESVRRYRKAISGKKKRTLLEKLTLPLTQKYEVVQNEPGNYLQSIQDPMIYPDEMLVTETDIYKVSNRMLELQKVLDHGLVTVWYPEILTEKKDFLE